LAAPQSEEQLRRILYELQLMEGSVNVLQQRSDLLANAAAELTMCKTSLAEMEKLPAEHPILVPAGGGAFIHAKTGDLSKVIIGIGADVSVEMERGRAAEEVGKRLEDVEKAQQSVQQQLAQLLEQMQAYQAAAQRLSAQLQGVSA
jgi:prefoldin alpha subunit